MKILNFVILFALSIFLVSNASAIVLTGLWQNGTTSMTIITGNSSAFTVDFGSEHPPISITESLYNSNDQLVWQNSHSGLSSGYVTDTIPASYLSAGLYQLIINGNDAKNYPDSDTLSLIVNSIVIPPLTDTIPPVVILNSPAGNSLSNSSLITFNGIVSDNIGISNVTLYIDNGITDQANFSGLNNTNYSFTFNLSNGIHSWNYRACDTSGNCAFSPVNRIITINTSSNSTNQSDTTAPQIQFVSPTPATNIFVSQNSITISVTASDSGSGLKNITINVYDFSRNLINSISSGNSPVSLSITLPSSTYYINATAYDNAGNSNSTETRIINIQSNNPSNGNQIETNSGYTYSDVYQNQYLQQLNRTNQGIDLTGQKVNSNSSAEFALLLIGIFLVLVLIGIILLIFANRKFKN